jgi:hypothetical protein
MEGAMRNFSSVSLAFQTICRHRLLLLKLEIQQPSVFELWPVRRLFMPRRVKDITFAVTKAAMIDWRSISVSCNVTGNDES